MGDRFDITLTINGREHALEEARVHRVDVGLRDEVAKQQIAKNRARTEIRP